MKRCSTSLIIREMKLKTTMRDCYQKWANCSLLKSQNRWLHNFFFFLSFVFMKWREMKVAQSRLTLCDPMDYTVHGILQAIILQWVAFPFPRGSTQGWNPGFPHCRQILYQLSHKGSPRILEWVAYPFSSGSSRPRNQTRVSHCRRFFTNWAMREARLSSY